MGGELTAAEAGLVVELPLFDAALDNVLKLARIVSGGGLTGHVKMGLNNIPHIPQQQGGPLLNVVGCAQIQLPLAPLHHRPGRAGGESGLDLVAPQVGEADGSAHMDAVDDPLQPRMPVDGLHQPPGGGGGHDIVAHPFYFHLRAGKEGIIPPDLQLNGHRRSLLS